MDQASFESFVKQHQPLQSDPERFADQQVSAQEELEGFLKQLDTLYEAVQSHLEPFVRAGQITIALGTVRLFEEEVGWYEAPSMAVRLGRIAIQFEPVGTFLIGMKGRVEVTGPAGNATLVLVSKEARDIASMVRVASNTFPSPPDMRIDIGPPTSDLPTVWVWKLMTATAQRTFVDLNAETVYELIAELSPA